MKKKIKTKINITVTYTDDSIETYDCISDAEFGIHNTVTGCDFATLPDTILVEQGKKLSELACSWSLRLEKLKD